MSYPVRGSRRDRDGGYDSFAALDAMQDRISRVLADALGGYRGRTPRWHPDIDVDETDDGWVVEARLPGVAPDEVAIDVSDRDLVIRAQHNEEESGDTGRRSRYADFSYRLSLPSDADIEAIDATMDHGLLRVRLPRATTQRSRRITIGRGAQQPATIESTATDSSAALGPAGGDRRTGDVENPIPMTDGKNLPGA